MDKTMDLLATIIDQTIGDLNVVITDDRDKCQPILKSISGSDITTSGHKTRISFADALNTQPKAPPMKNEVTKVDNGKRQPLKTNTSSPPFGYDLIKIMRKHSRRGDLDDAKTSIWDIKFKSRPKADGKQLVATCGGNIVNIIDIKTGTVAARYTDATDHQTFNCLVWRDFDVNTGQQETGTTGQPLRSELSVLCCGGTKKRNKLVDIVIINADNLQDYQLMSSHSQSVNCLMFHPKHRNLLFSGSYDKKIMIWSLDLKSWTNTSTVASMSIKKLHEIDCQNRALSMIYVPRVSALVVAGEDGLMFTKDPTQRPCQSGRWYTVQLPEKYKLVDGLALVDHHLPYVAFRYKDRIIIADFDLMIKSLKGMTSTDANLIPISQVTQLGYFKLKCNYFYMSVVSGLLAYGDADGRVRLYHLNDSVLRPATGLQKENDCPLVEPNRVLSMPQLNKISIDKQSAVTAVQSLPQTDNLFVNTVAISCDREYIVSGTNNNLVCIWRRSPHPSSHNTQPNKKFKTVNAL